MPDIHSTVAALRRCLLPLCFLLLSLLLQLNNFHSLSVGVEWTVERTAASWQLFRVQQQIKFALVIGFQNTSTTAVFNAANSHRSFSTHTRTPRETHSEIFHELDMRTDVVVVERLLLMLSCQRLWGSTLLAACLCHCYSLPAACLLRPPWGAVVMLPSLTELWPRKCKPCRRRSRIRIRSRTAPRTRLRPRRHLYTRAAFPWLNSRRSSLSLSLLPLLLPAISTGKSSGRRRK